MRKQLKCLFLIAVLIGLLAAGFVLTSCSPVGSGTPETITIGAANEESAGLIFIARGRGFFTANNLEYSASGPSYMSRMAKGEIDLALVAEYPVVASAFRKEKISIIGSIDKITLISIFALRERGIERVSDLWGKRIGVIHQSLAEFYIGRFLELNGMRLQDVTLVDVKPDQYVEVISNGNVDAIVAGENSVGQLRENQGDRLVIWSVHSSQPAHVVLVARNDWIEQHPDLVERLLKSLAQAESYLIRHPDEAKVIIRTSLRYDDNYMKGVWERNRFSLSLDYSLIAAMNDEAYWTISNNLYMDGLKAVKPEAVGIIR